MTVLVAYDGSEQSEFALKMAVDMFPDQQLYLAHIIKPFADHTEAGGYSAGRYETEWENAESMLEGVIDSLPEGRVTDTEIRYGRPVHQLLSIADDADIDHIVMGSHGRDGAKRLLLGSVAETVVRRASEPVTVIRETPSLEDGSIERVVVPFDGSKPAKAALSHAVEQYPEAEITALYVIYPKPEGADPDEKDFSDAIQDWTEHHDDYAQEIIDLADEHTEQSIQTKTIAGDPASGIVQYAEDHDVDHIVIGSHGREGLKRLVLGSVAEKVVRRAPTSVTVVRDQEE